MEQINQLNQKDVLVQQLDFKLKKIHEENLAIIFLNLKILKYI